MYLSHSGLLSYRRLPSWDFLQTTNEPPEKPPSPAGETISDLAVELHCDAMLEADGDSPTKMGMNLSKAKDCIPRMESTHRLLTWVLTRYRGASSVLDMTVWANPEILGDWPGMFEEGSPVKRGFPSVETWSTTQTTQTYEDLQSRRILQNVGNTAFLPTYLNGGSLNLTEWSLEEQGLVSELKCAGPTQEESLYTGRASLLRLLNSISERVFKSMNTNRGEALVFYSGRKCKVQSPFTKQHRSPHIVALWETAQVFPTIEYSNDRLPDTTWCALATIGEAQVAGKPKSGLASHLRLHLQFHPELNAVLGFTVWPSGYGLFYHDAEVIHQSDFSWQQPGPLYAFVEKLYTRPFRDTSMQMLNAGGPDPVWATKIGDDVYVSEAPRPQAAPGQRRYITVANNATTDEVVFLKDIWRDTGRRFFEGLLLKQAHEGENLSGLMMAKSHGYVLDESGKQIRTTSLDSLEKQAGGRFKMRMITRDVGRPLEE
ncbi:hypothetical protein FRC11_009201, partial [Ceratobasidium sp. 423]